MASQDAFDPHTFLAHVGAGRTLATHRRQSPIFAQGDVADAVFYIQRGQVKLTVVSARGKEAVIAILEAQAFFGEGCLAGQPRRIATAMALTDCALMRIEKSAMLHVLHADLSPYNILWTGEDYRIIDFPQAVDPRFNGNALAFLQRDIENVGRFCARFAEIPDPQAVALEIWSRFQRGETPAS